jgi:hypothetical protein
LNFQCPRCRSLNTQRSSPAIWVILAVGIAIDLVGRRLMPDPLRFDTLVVGGMAVLGVIFEERVCLNCGHDGKAFTFLPWW